VGLAGSGQLGRFNRKTSEWKFWDNPGVKFKAPAQKPARPTSVLPVVDQFDVSGLGKDTVFVTGSASDAFFVFDPKKETFSCSTSRTRCRTTRVVWTAALTTRRRAGRVAACG